MLQTIGSGFLWSLGAIAGAIVAVALFCLAAVVLIVVIDIVHRHRLRRLWQRSEAEAAAAMRAGTRDAGGVVRPFRPRMEGRS